MGDLTKNFSRWEYECHGLDCCGHSAPVHPKLVSGMQKLADLVDAKYGNGEHIPIDLNSGFRCLKHNRHEGSNDTSEHPKATAADPETPNCMTSEEFAELAEQVPEFREGGIGIYATWIHVDVRDGAPARWTL